MRKKVRDDSSRRRLIRNKKNRIAAKLAVAGTCLVLSATATVAKQIDAAPGAMGPEAAIADRMDGIRSRLQADGLSGNGFLRSLKRVAQWYNWPNWRNGWSNWRNYRWFNW